MAKGKVKKPKGKLGGKRPGAGRKPGSASIKTLERMKVNEELRQRTLKVVPQLFDSQLSLARGQMFLFRIDKVWVTPPSGKGGWWKNKKPVLVTNKDEIASYLEGAYDGGDEDDGGASYYYITTKEPNGGTIESMLDRALGGAPKSLEITNPDGSLKSVVIIKSTDVKKRGD